MAAPKSSKLDRAISNVTMEPGLRDFNAQTADDAGDDMRCLAELDWTLQRCCKCEKKTYTNTSSSLQVAIGLGSRSFFHSQVGRMHKLVGCVKPTKRTNHIGTLVWAPFGGGAV